MEKDLAAITDLPSIQKLAPDDLYPHVHIIIGPGAMCMCGSYDGASLSCSQILTGAISRQRNQG